MKKLVYVCAIILGVSFASCDGNNKKESAAPAQENAESTAAATGDEAVKVEENAEAGAEVKEEAKQEAEQAAEQPAEKAPEAVK